MWAPMKRNESCRASRPELRLGVFEGAKMREDLFEASASTATNILRVDGALSARGQRLCKSCRARVTVPGG